MPNKNRGESAMAKGKEKAIGRKAKAPKGNQPAFTSRPSASLSLRYDSLLTGLADLLQAARVRAIRTINASLTGTYWEMGRRIVEYEQEGQDRAAYGIRLLPQLADDLTKRFGKGFGLANLNLMRQFYLVYPERGPILQTLSGKSVGVFRAGILQTPSGEFPLSWSHYVRLLSVRDDAERYFYEAEARMCIRGGISHIPQELQ